MFASKFLKKGTLILVEKAELLVTKSLGAAKLNLDSDNKSIVDYVSEKTLQELVKKTSDIC